jgi:hypothetical protein
MTKQRERLGKMKMEPAGEIRARIIVSRMVLDPAISDAEYYHLRRTRSGPDVGKVKATVNLVELIGGLARIKGRSALQEEAAARYRRLWDQAQIGSTRATDYTRVRVDISGSGADVLEFGEWARAEYGEAVRYLGMGRSSLIERVVVHDQSLRQVAGAGGKAAGNVRQQLLEVLDDLAVHFNLTARKGP